MFTMNAYVCIIKFIHAKKLHTIQTHIIRIYKKFNYM